MYRYGIVSRNALPTDLSMQTDEPPMIAFSMLAEFSEPLRECDEVAIEMICNAMATGHGLIHRRRTFPRRYDPVNEAILETAKAELPDARPLRVYDVAVSNGVSSLEFFEMLSRDFDPAFWGMDYLDSIKVVGPFGQWSVIFDNVDRPLQFVGHHFVIPVNERPPARYPINRVLRAWLKGTILPRAQKALQERIFDSDVRVHKIDAFHPKARAMAEKEPRFRLGQGDMYKPIEDRFDLIRAMSVFSNLDREQISRAVAALCESLVEGGLFAVGRNRGRGTREIPTTIFRREGERLVALVDLMGGAEQKQIILSTELGRPR